MKRGKNKQRRAKPANPWSGASVASIDAWARRAAQVKPEPERDPLMVGDSPALERYRAARARMAELDLEERQRTHVDVRRIEGGILLMLRVVGEAGAELR